MGRFIPDDKLENLKLYKYSAVDKFVAAGVHSWAEWNC